MKKKKVSETRQNLKLSWKYVKKRKKKLLLLGFISLLISLIGILVPLLTAKLLLNLSGGFLVELIKIAGFILVIELFRNVCNVCGMYFYDKFMIDTLTEVQMEMFEETLRIEKYEMDKQTSGTFIERINNDTNDIIGIFDGLVSEVLDFISNFGVFMAVIFISFPMFIYFLISSIIIAIIRYIRRKKMYERQKKYRTIREKKTGLISEIVRGVSDIKLLNADKEMLRKTKGQLEKVNREYFEMTKIGRNLDYWADNVFDFTSFMFIAFGAYLVRCDMLTIANFVILYTYRSRIEGLLGYYNRIAEMLKRYNLSATRVFEILGDKFKKERCDGISLDNIKGNIEFKNVSFSYDEVDVLKDVSFKINAGERVGFVGESGSGKSTIFNLIVGLYSIKNGNIFIDGVNINDISLESVRKSISLIPQNPYIFNFSVKDNLLLSNGEASDSEIIKACKKAEIYDRIMEFDDKFDTFVGEGGITLSGGERQRLAIARTLLKNSNILLFDEATSALDNITQDKVQQSIYGLDKEKTILIIAHRLSTIINCDKIVVVKDGKILDVGSHDELLNRCSFYQKLYKHDHIE